MALAASSQTCSGATGIAWKMEFIKREHAQNLIALAAMLGWQKFLVDLYTEKANL